MKSSIYDKYITCSTTYMAHSLIVGLK